MCARVVGELDSMWLFAPRAGSAFSILLTLIARETEQAGYLVSRLLTVSTPGLAGDGDPTNSWKAELAIAFVRAAPLPSCLGMF